MLFKPSDEVINQKVLKGAGMCAAGAIAVVGLTAAIVADWLSTSAEETKLSGEVDDGGSTPL